MGTINHNYCNIPKLYDCVYLIIQITRIRTWKYQVKPLYDMIKI